MPLRVALAWLLACGLWSSTFLFIRVGLQDTPPFTFAWVRLAIAVVVLGICAAFNYNCRTKSPLIALR